MRSTGSVANEPVIIVPTSDKSVAHASVNLGGDGLTGDTDQPRRITSVAGADIFRLSGGVGWTLEIASIGY